jgi:cytochrome c-type biogenesis protein CcmE
MDTRARPPRAYDRPYELACELDVTDENGDVLVSHHLLPRSVAEGMGVVLRTPEGRFDGTVTDVDWFYGLVAIRVEK